jgi:molecular chaperone HtpG
MAEEKLSFQAEVSRLLDIVANSLYSNKEIFLRELISNASDACDRLRYAAITNSELAADDPHYKIRLSIDRKARTITVADNGIGMNRQDLIDNLGTIAQSGTAAFVEQLDDSAAGVNLIGRFGVGFYSAFMVADQVEVHTRKAGEGQGWHWTSDGKAAFTIAEAAEKSRGTRIVLHIRKADAEFVDPARLGRIVRTYSDHIAAPIVLVHDGKEEMLNTGSALWIRSKAEITDAQYNEFYHHVGHAFDDPWLRTHFKVEGVIEYAGLLFIPSMRPLDLFHPDRKHKVKLYVKRVFITEDCEGLVPAYLRFLVGVIDSEDLPLNISREVLQHNPMVGKIRSAVVKRVLGELKKKADRLPDDYAKFWNTFGSVLKEGIYEDEGQRETLLELARFHTTSGPGLVGLSAYIDRMKEGQEAIYYISGEDLQGIAKSPQLEGFTAKGVEVLLLTDPVDEFWIPAVRCYRDRPFKSVTRGGADLGNIKVEAGAADKEDSEKETITGMNALIAFIKLALKDDVKDVRTSERLTESPVCLVADEGDLDIHLERLLKQHRQIDAPFKRILEINPKHSLIRCLAASVGTAGAAKQVEEVARLLLDQARILEGETLPDPMAYSRRVAALVEQGLKPLPPPV